MPIDRTNLYLIPSALTPANPLQFLPEHTLTTIFKLQCFIVEDLKTSRRFLKSIAYPHDLSEVRFLLYNEHTSDSDLISVILPSILENDCGLLSEAGLPCIADPGAKVVKLAHQHNISVIPLTGPSSIFLALMASGFNGQQFIFHGYLPVNKVQLRKKILDIEAELRKNNYTHIFIETPYRNMQLFETLLSVCNGNTMLCIATGLQSDSEAIRTLSVSEWKHIPIDINRQPSVFLLSRS